MHPLLPSSLLHRQSSDAARLGYVNRGKEAGGGESGVESEDRVSTSPSSIQIHLQTLHLNTACTAAKSPAKVHSPSQLYHSRAWNQRKKWNSGGVSRSCFCKQYTSLRITGNNYKCLIFFLRKFCFFWVCVITYCHYVQLWQLILQLRWIAP